MSYEQFMDVVHRRLKSSITQMDRLYERDPKLSHAVKRTSNCSVAKDVPRAINGAAAINLNNQDVLREHLATELNSFLDWYLNFFYVQALASVYTAAISSTKSLPDARMVFQTLVNMNMHLYLLDFSSPFDPLHLVNLCSEAIPANSSISMEMLPYESIGLVARWIASMFFHELPNQNIMSHLLHYWVNSPGYAVSYVAASLLHNQLPVSCAAALEAWRENGHSSELLSCIEKLPRDARNWSAKALNDATQWMAEHPPIDLRFDGRGALMDWMAGEQQYLRSDLKYDQSSFYCGSGYYWIAAYVTIPAVVLVLVLCWIRRRRSASKPSVLPSKA